MMSKIDDQKLEKVAGGETQAKYTHDKISYTVKQAGMTLNDIFNDFESNNISYKKNELIEYFSSALGYTVNPSTIIPRGVYNNVPVYQLLVTEN